MFEHCLRISNYTIDVRDAASRNLISREGLQWVTRVCLLYVGI